MVAARDLVLSFRRARERRSEGGREKVAPDAAGAPRSSDFSSHPNIPLSHLPLTSSTEHILLRISVELSILPLLPETRSTSASTAPLSPLLRVSCPTLRQYSRHLQVSPSLRHHETYYPPTPPLLDHLLITYLFFQIRNAELASSRPPVLSQHSTCPSSPALAFSAHEYAILMNIIIPIHVDNRQGRAGNARVSSSTYPFEG